MYGETFHSFSTVLLYVAISRIYLKIYSLFDVSCKHFLTCRLYVLKETFYIIVQHQSTNFLHSIYLGTICETIHRVCL